MYYKRKINRPWKVIKGGLFNIESKTLKPLYPTGTPPPLFPDYNKEQFNGANLRKSLSVWKKYFPKDSDAEQEWKTLISNFELWASDSIAKETYSKGSEEDNITLQSFKPYNPKHVPNSAAYIADQSELDAIAVEELANPTVSVFYEVITTKNVASLMGVTMGLVMILRYNNDISNLSLSTVGFPWHL